MCDVVDTAVGRSHAFDGDRAMGLENVVVALPVDLAFRRHKPLRLVKKLLTERAHFRGAGGGIHTHVQPPGSDARRKGAPRAAG